MQQEQQAENPLGGGLGLVDERAELRARVETLTAENNELRRLDQLGQMSAPAMIEAEGPAGGEDDDDESDLRVSEHFVELLWIGKLCCGADGRPTVLYRVMQLLIIVRVATSGGRGYAEAAMGEIYDAEGNPKPNDLHHAASAFYGLARRRPHRRSARSLYSLIPFFLF